ncbi:hypothetical protein A2617_02100 [Candidatus Daviesbacteria bacterium RIFOXYD1_FULL_41_10]|uniref:Type II secretion system protein GspG C-terminal domain-containing protein n=2 Tax=Candidatus Daviesiibacteriota TaxID=1752718 RepID=A0A1F5N258_9BACT|nr:MAG: hypothetical protein UU67_C0064G0002 [Candidatus Daviesbacteria bacterium GW2011_GWB1_41_5]OGE71714.1 MAG: hypothetical protein A2617_02100 [Candidatus Daviesbacteria bacterium RIFOXYD1_FULL_41_10]
MKRPACVYPEQSRRGFTLIELLVVITIIVILSTIGVAVYSAAQATARDGARRAEVDQIAKAIETSRDLASGVYRYDLTMAAADFPRNPPADPIPKDPLNHSDTNDMPKYIIWTSSSSMGDRFLFFDYSAVDSNLIDWQNTVFPKPNSSVPGYWNSIPSIINCDNEETCLNRGLIKSWKICARMERDTEPYCVQSLSP